MCALGTSNRLEGVPLVLDRYFGPHAAPSLEYNLVLSQSDKLRDSGGGLGRNVQMLNGLDLTPPALVPALAVSPSRSKTSVLIDFTNKI